MDSGRRKDLNVRRMKHNKLSTKRGWRTSKLFQNDELRASVNLILAYKNEKTLATKGQIILTNSALCLAIKSARRYYSYCECIAIVEEN